MDNSFNVLRSRIDRFGVVQPNIQQLEVAGRILIEMPGVKEPERVRKLLQGSADLEFWETMEFAEIQEAIMSMNTMVRDLEKVHTADSAVAETAQVVTNDSASANASGIDSLLASVDADSTAILQENAEKWAKENRGVDFDDRRWERYKVDPDYFERKHTPEMIKQVREYGKSVDPKHAIHKRPLDTFVW